MSPPYVRDVVLEVQSETENNSSGEGVPKIIIVVRGISKNNSELRGIKRNKKKHNLLYVPNTCMTVYFIQ